VRRELSHLTDRELADSPMMVSRASLFQLSWITPALCWP
jgi:hypothetical protein